MNSIAKFVTFLFVLLLYFDGTLFDHLKISSDVFMIVGSLGYNFFIITILIMYIGLFNALRISKNLLTVKVENGNIQKCETILVFVLVILYLFVISIYVINDIFITS